MRTQVRGWFLLVTAWLLLAVSAPAQAQPPTPQTPVTVGTAGGDVTILADRLEQVGGADNLVIATGNVEITRGASRLMADRVQINRTTGDALAEGRVVFYDGEDQLTGQRIEYNLRTGTGVVYKLGQALFGVDSDPADGCRRALIGAQAMVEAIAELSAAMAAELSEPLRIGVGIHTGPAVVGRMGYGSTVYLTAVGDTVHVASRLQDLTKDYQAQVVISEQVGRRADVDVSMFLRYEITVRNRREPLAIRVIDDVSALDTAQLRGEPPTSPVDGSHR